MDSNFSILASTGSLLRKFIQDILTEDPEWDLYSPAETPPRRPREIAQGSNFNPPKPTILTVLPPELLLQIFSHVPTPILLTTVRCVCKAFNTIVLLKTNGKIYGLTLALWEYILTLVDGAPPYTEGNVIRLVSRDFKDMIDYSKIETIRRWRRTGKIPDTAYVGRTRSPNPHKMLRRYLKGDPFAYFHLSDPILDETATNPPVDTLKIRNGTLNRLWNRKDSFLPPLRLKFLKTPESGNVISLREVLFIYNEIVLRYWPRSVTLRAKDGYLYVSEGFVTRRIMADIDVGKTCTEDIVGEELDLRMRRVEHLKERGIPSFGYSQKYRPPLQMYKYHPSFVVWWQVWPEPGLFPRAIYPAYEPTTRGYYHYNYNPRRRLPSFSY
ncbi:hypothetical protein ABW19_dt0200802 [Dactylella cylindrospora]|nr:hypothetical protein ABW19_dt0200802 [Dactylella cylindrospora]